MLRHLGNIVNLSVIDSILMIQSKQGCNLEKPKTTTSKKSPTIYQITRKTVSITPLIQNNPI